MGRLKLKFGNGGLLGTPSGISGEKSGLALFRYRHQRLKVRRLLLAIPTLGLSVPEYPLAVTPDESS